LIGRRFVFGILSAFAVSTAGAAGCGSDHGGHDPDFVVCEGTPAVKYTPGIFVTSTSGAYRATLDSAITVGPPAADSPEVGWGTWVVSVTDAAAGTPADVSVTAERPWMPRHGHGATTYPVVTPGVPGTFTVSEINFFMAGYWELSLNLTPPGGVPDDAAFAICIPQ
jgi:hypothetical protein